IVATAIFLVVAVWQSREHLDRADFFFVLAGAGALKIAYQSGEVYWGVYQRREQLHLLGRSNAVRGFAMLATFALLVPLASWGVRVCDLPTELLPRGVAIAVWLTVGFWLTIGYFIDRPRTVTTGQVDLGWSWPNVGRLALQALPLGLVALLISL